MRVVVLAAGASLAPVLLASQAPIATVPASTAPAAVRALRTTAAIRLDGVPDEPAWLSADSITDFTQREPHEGESATERTVVRLLATDAGLWVALWAYDRTRERIRRSQLRRDADLGSDDRFAILLDPQSDRRSGYVFQVNPNGALYDGEVRSHENVNADWNGVWDARARLADFGWTAELFIPWQTLRYPAAGGRWGMNCGRFIRHKNEEVLWRSWRRQQGILYQLDEGALDGLGALPARPRLEARPYALTSGSAPTRDYLADGSDTVVAAAGGDAKVGLDAKVAVSPTLTLDLTANTDFAQVEADRQVVNLTRFPVFFPEKRPFFLEAAGIFDFGQTDRTSLFNSRRIGLDATGAPVPITAGARLSGRAGHERLGLLALRTGGAEDAVDVAARIKHDAFERGYVGAMLTGQGGPGVPSRRVAGGADFQFPLLLHGQNIVPTGFVAFSRDSGGAPTATAWRLFLDYPNDWSDDFLAINRVEAGFDPVFGFVRQAGVWRYTGALRFFPRPRNGLGIRSLSLKPVDFDIITNLDGTLNNAAYEVRPIGARFQSGDEFELNLQRGEDLPPDSFEIFPGTVVASGHYAWNRVELGLSSSSGRPVSFATAVSAGRYYTGTATSLAYEVTVRAAPHVIASLDGGLQRVRLATGAFTARVARLRLDYAASPRLGTTLFVQYDNESQRLAVNARLHWIPEPGSDAYLVWNTAWPTGLDRGIPWGRPLRGAVIGKLVYYFRL